MVRMQSKQLPSNPTKPELLHHAWASGQISVEKYLKILALGVNRSPDTMPILRSLTADASSATTPSAESPAGAVRWKCQSCMHSNQARFTCVCTMCGRRPPRGISLHTPSSIDTISSDNANYSDSSTNLDSTTKCSGISTYSDNRKCSDSSVHSDVVSKSPSSTSLRNGKEFPSGADEARESVLSLEADELGSPKPYLPVSHEVPPQFVGEIKILQDPSSNIP